MTRSSGIVVSGSGGTGVSAGMTDSFRRAARMREDRRSARESARFPDMAADAA
ncbi:hypothetical protein GCM10022205_01070 [Spinactinospora alkalitolerans]